MNVSISKQITLIRVLWLCLATASFSQTSLTLAEAVEIAAAKSPDIRRARLNLERSRESLNAQNAALKSQFSLSINPFEYNRARQFNTFFSTWNTSEEKSSSGTFRISQPIQWTDATLSLINRFEWRDSFSEFQDERSKTFSNNLYISYAQPLFTYNRTRLQLHALELDLEDASLSYALQLLTLEYIVTQNFYDVHRKKLAYQIAIEEFNNQDQSYQIIKNKVDAGLAAKEELFQAELNLSTSKSKVQNTKVDLDNTLDEFKRLIGISLFDEVTVSADVTHQVVEVDLQKALDNGLEKRMELRQRNIDIETAMDDLVERSAYNEFRGDFSLSYGIIGTDEQYQHVYDKPTKNQQIFLAFEVPLFDWGEKKSRIKAAEASLNTSRLSSEEQRNDIIIGVRQAYRSLKNLEIQIDIAQQNVRNAELTYEINLERYKNGDLTSMDLNLFQTQLSDSKTGLVQALTDYKVALLNLKIQSMWDFEKNRQVITEVP